MRNQIVVLSRKDDAHIPYVQRHLSSPLVHIDVSRTIDGTELTFRPTESKVVFDGQKLDSVKSVWFRKPVLMRDIKIPVKEEYHEYSMDGFKRHTDALKAFFPDAFWLSDYYATLRASNKAWQLRLAQSKGFLIPQTIITSNREAALDFINSQAEVIAKPLSAFPPRVGRVSILPAIKFSKESVNQLAGLHLAPSIFQEAIEAVADIRVTVVGKKVFASIIEDKGIAGADQVRDYRISHVTGKTTFSPYELSKELSDLCVLLVESMGLSYGALDFVLDRKGDTWFLEINPNGQWAFVEHDTKQPIGKAIAELLERPI